VRSAQLQLLTEVAAETSGTKNSTSVSSDPSGAAIYNFLTTQAQAADTANQNISDASNAINVAQGATGSIQTVLDQVNTLAIEANNGFNSSSDNAALQAQVTQDTQTINQIAGETTFNGVPLLTGANAGATAPVQTTAPALTIQSGTNEGQTTAISLPNATTTGLGITNLDVTTPASAANTEGQVNAAENTLGLGDASVGAQSDGLGYAFQNNATLSDNLTASASAIGDTQVGASSIASNLASIQQQISIAILSRANTDAGHLSSFLSQYA
jgi:flagellin